LCTDDGNIFIKIHIYNIKIFCRIESCVEWLERIWQNINTLNEKISWDDANMLRVVMEINLGHGEEDQRNDG